MPTESPSFEYIELENLQFDQVNPRFPTSLDGTDQQVVLRFMLQDAGLIDLMRSIAKQGFFPGEPLLVSPVTGAADKWVVVEGNRRLAACTLLVSPELAPSKQQAVRDVAAGADLSKIVPVPCLQFPSREAILAHLGYRHVTGIKEWDPLAKARFLEQQFAQETGTTDERLRNTARSIGSRSDYVGRLLTAFRLYKRLEENAFYSIKGLSETSITFSLIPSILAYSAIVTYLGLKASQDLDMIGLDESKWEFLARFIFEQDRDGKSRLGESRNIRTLADVLDNGHAREAHERGTTTLMQAKQLLGGSDSAFRGFVSQADQSLELARLEMDGVSFGPHDVEAIERVRLSAVTLRKAVQDHIDESV